MKSKCDKHKVDLIDRCALCGAPQCCPVCCMESFQELKRDSRESLLSACIPKMFHGPLPEYIRIWFGKKPSDDGPEWQEISDKMQAGIHNAVEGFLEGFKLEVKK